MLEAKIKSVIRDVPDFPKPGILFKDITPIFHDQQLCNEIVSEFANRLVDKILMQSLELKVADFYSDSP